AVEPNRVTSRVFNEWHWGHLTAMGIMMGPSLTADFPVGGAMPYSSSLRLPSSDIQSVVQAGVSTRSTLASWYPAAANALVTSAEMVSMAGQPEHVGVMGNTAVPSTISTPRRMPRSSIVSTGTSGSGTVFTTSHSSAACWSFGRRASEVVITTSLLGTAGQAPAFR